MAKTHTKHHNRAPVTTIAPTASYTAPASSSSGGGLHILLGVVVLGAIIFIVMVGMGKIPGISFGGQTAGALFPGTDTPSPVLTTHPAIGDGGAGGIAGGIFGFIGGVIALGALWRWVLPESWKDRVRGAFGAGRKAAENDTRAAGSALTASGRRARSAVVAGTHVAYSDATDAEARAERAAAQEADRTERAARQAESERLNAARQAQIDAAAGR